MGALVRGELIKLRTTRTALGFAAAGLLLVLAVVILSILAGKPTSVDDKRDALNFGNVLSAILLLFGVVGAAAEYRHRTLAPALLIAPDRARLTLARTLSYAAAALAIAIAMGVITFAIGLPLLGGRPGPGLAGADYARVAAGGLLVCVLDVIIGVGIGTLVSVQVPAVIGTLIWFFVLEPLIPLLSDGAAKFTIGQASGAVGGTTGDTSLGFVPGALVLVAWAALFMVLGVLVDRRRDVT